MDKNLNEILDELSSKEFLNILTKITSINNLFLDKALGGGGLNQVFNGGSLNIHTDFISHIAEKKWKRVLNLLIYFNHNWLDEYNGHLEFWDEDAYEDLKNDAKIILKKLNIDLSLYKKKHIILDEPAFNTSVLIEEIVGKEKAKKYNSEDEEYIDEYIQFIPPYDYDHHLEAGADIRD